MRARRGAGWLVALGLALLAGCAGTQARLESALLVAGPAVPARDLEAHYRVRCPDVVEVDVPTHPGCSGRHPVGVDGRVRLTADLAVRVDGLTTAEIAGEVARRLRLPSNRVRVTMAEHRSQYVSLHADPADHQVLPYRGPESVLDLLRRAGLPRKGAALGEVCVVRAHVADGKPPEVFQVDLRAVLLGRDPATNIRLEPFDRIHVGRTSRSRVEAAMPGWLRPLYRRAFGER